MSETNKRQILFLIIGKPLLHPLLPKMIAYLSEHHVAEDYEIVTNVSFLTPDLSKTPVDAWLTRCCVFCCIVPYALSYGNVHRDDLVAMWNGAKRRALLELHLKKKQHIHPICRDCVHPNAAIFPANVLDDAAEEILKRIRKK